MRGSSNIVIGFAAAFVGAIAIYGWGLGWFDPCGPVDDVLGASACRVVARVEGESVDILLLEGDVSVLAVVSQTGPTPMRAPRTCWISRSPTGPCWTTWIWRFPPTPRPSKGRSPAMAHGLS